MSAQRVPDEHLIHDRDRGWGADFGQRASGLAIKSLRTPIRAPRANSIAVVTSDTAATAE